MARTSMRHGIVQECADLFGEDVRNALYFGESEAASGTDTPHGWIEIKADSRGNIEVAVFHDEGGGHPCPRLEAAIRAALPTWGEVAERYAEERQEEGEYEGTLDCAFADWQDYCRYMYG